MANYAVITDGVVSNIYISDQPLNAGDVQTDTAQIGWSYTNGAFNAPPLPVPTPEQLHAALIASAARALALTDRVASRCTKAGVAFPADWQAFYKAALAIYNGTDTISTDLPEMPKAYPAGTYEQ